MAGALVVYVIAGHEELAWKRRVAVCVFPAGVSFSL
jgi:hypothetical protein